MNILKICICVSTYFAPKLFYLLIQLYTKYLASPCIATGRSCEESAEVRILSQAASGGHP